MSTFLFLPVKKLREVVDPMSSFYRYVLDPEVQFTADGRLSPGPMARFSNMPPAPLLTQNMHVPDNWLVEAVASPYDLDNIRLEEVDSVVHRSVFIRSLFNSYQSLSAHYRPHSSYTSLKFSFTMLVSSILKVLFEVYLQWRMVSILIYYSRCFPMSV